MSDIRHCRADSAANCSSDCFTSSREYFSSELNFGKSAHWGDFLGQKTGERTRDPCLPILSKFLAVAVLTACRHRLETRRLTECDDLPHQISRCATICRIVEAIKHLYDEGNGRQGRLHSCIRTKVLSCLGFTSPLGPIEFFVG